MPSTHHALRQTKRIISALGVLLLVLWALSPYLGGKGIAGYAPLHTFLETLSIVVSAVIFMVWWSTRQQHPELRTALIAAVFLSVGLIDFLHVLSYQGMPDFVTPGGPEKAIDFWLAARLMAACGFLVAVFYRSQSYAGRGQDYALLGGALAVSALVAWAVLFHEHELPATFVPGKGLTPFKVYSEYVLVTLYGVAAYGALRELRDGPSESRARMLVYVFAAAGISALSELFFTLYASVTDLFNLFGHVYKVIAYTFLYQAIVSVSIRSPYQQLQTTQQALSDREAELDAIVRSAAHAIITVDETQTIVRFNPSAAHIFGCPASEAVGGPLDRFIPAGAREAHRHHLIHYAWNKDAGAHSMGGDRILMALRADGSEFPIDATISYTEVAGRKLYTVMLRDVTERVQHHEALQRYADIVRSSSDAILSRTLDGTVLTWNPAADRLYGYSSEEIVGNDINKLYSPRTPADQRDLTQRAASGEAIVNFETLRQHKDGSDVHVAITISPVHDRNGKIIGSSGITRDITERKRMETELHTLIEHQRQAEVELRESRNRLRELSSALQTIREEEKTRIARELHDELGQALTALKMDIAAIEHELEQQRENASLCERAIAMKRLIETTVLSVRRIAADLRPVMLDNLGLVPTLEWLVKDFATRNGIQADLDIPDEDLMIEGDAATAIFRITQEALTNVSRHSRADWVGVEVRRDSGNVVVRISDNGKGIAEQDTRKSRSFGLLGMRERTYVLGGDLKISTPRQGGTVIEAVVPIFGKGKEQAA